MKIKTMLKGNSMNIMQMKSKRNRASKLVKNPLPNAGDTGLIPSVRSRTPYVNHAPQYEPSFEPGVTTIEFIFTTTSQVTRMLGRKEKPLHEQPISKSAM